MPDRSYVLARFSAKLVRSWPLWILYLVVVGIAAARVNAVLTVHSGAVVYAEQTACLSFDGAIEKSSCVLVGELRTDLGGDRVLWVKGNPESRYVVLDRAVRYPPTEAGPSAPQTGAFALALLLMFGPMFLAYRRFGLLGLTPLAGPLPD
jgi:hypothetical protein